MNNRPTKFQALIIATVGLLALSRPAEALFINPIYDSTVTGRSDFASIQSAFGTAAAAYSGILGSNVTVNIQVSFGRVASYAMPTNALGASVDPLYGYYSFAQIKSWLSAAATTAYDKLAIANLGGSSAAGNRFVLPKAEAKALGLIAGNGTAIDGYIGFGTGINWDYTPTNGVVAGAYDFTAVAAHEIDEVLGRISGLASATPGYATPFDLFRCAAGVSSFSYSATAYFSIDGCKTNLSNFNNVGSGDRGDFAGTSNPNDLQNAYLGTGRVEGLSLADAIALDVLGWGGATLPTSGLTGSQLLVLNLDVAAPEPASMALLVSGLIGLGLLRRRRGA